MVINLAQPALLSPEAALSILGGADLHGLIALIATQFGVMILGIVAFVSICIASINAWRQRTRVRDQMAYNHLVGAMGGLVLNLLGHMGVLAIPHGPTTRELRVLLDQAVLPWIIITLGLWPLIAFIRYRRATARSAERRASDARGAPARWPVQEPPA